MQFVVRKYGTLFCSHRSNDKSARQKKTSLTFFFSGTPQVNFNYRYAETVLKILFHRKFTWCSQLRNVILCKIEIQLKRLSSTIDKNIWRYVMNEFVALFERPVSVYIACLVVPLWARSYLLCEPIPSLLIETPGTETSRTKVKTYPLEDIVSWFIILSQFTKQLLSHIAFHV